MRIPTHADAHDAHFFLCVFSSPISPDHLRCFFLVLLLRVLVDRRSPSTCFRCGYHHDAVVSRVDVGVVYDGNAEESEEVYEAHAPRHEDADQLRPVLVGGVQDEFHHGRRERQQDCVIEQTEYVPSRFGSTSPVRRCRLGSSRVARSFDGCGGCGGRPGGGTVRFVAVQGPGHDLVLQRLRGAQQERRHQYGHRDDQTVQLRTR